MEIIEFKLGENQPISVGLPREGNIQCMLSFKYSSEGMQEEVEIHVNGYSADSKYNWISAKTNSFDSIRITKSTAESLKLPEPLPKRKIEMPNEEKLKLYLKLKDDLERKNLI